jgi:Flp pilus assembly protein TadG
MIILCKKSTRGNVTIIICLIMAGLLGFAAYVVDIGLVYADKIKLSNALDAAALAAVLELPNDSIKATNMANLYLQNNNMDPKIATITIGDSNHSIQISAVYNVKHFFAPLIGISSSNVNANTKAVIGPIKSVSSGIRPFAVQTYNFSYGSTVTLKQGGGNGYQGNYGVVALGGNGSSVYLNNGLYGYKGKISVGNWINTEPGNMAGSTNQIKNYLNSEQSSFNNFSRNSIRIWTLPLVNTLTVNGKNQVLVTGFGEFYVESADNVSGKLEITGRFIKYVMNGDIDMTIADTGLYGAKLSN